MAKKPQEYLATLKTVSRIGLDDLTDEQLKQAGSAVAGLRRWLNGGKTHFATLMDGAKIMTVNGKAAFVHFGGTIGRVEEYNTRSGVMEIVIIGKRTAQKEIAGLGESAKVDFVDIPENLKMRQVLETTPKEEVAA